MIFLMGQDHFSIEKMHEFDVFNECVTRPTDQPTNQPTDRAYHRDARTHLKRRFINTREQKKKVPTRVPSLRAKTRPTAVIDQQ